MAKKPLTDKEKNARAAKARATREANKKKALEQMGLSTERKKIRKPRKPMTEEQKKAAAERLAKAREAKAAAGEGPKYSNYDASVVERPEDDPWSVKNIHEWIKHNKEKLKGMRGWKDSKDRKERDAYKDCDLYIHNLQAYLRTGVWFDYRTGLEGENKVKTVCVAMAYHTDGTPKRTYGVWYPDIQQEWTPEFEKQYEAEET